MTERMAGGGDRLDLIEQSDLLGKTCTRWWKQRYNFGAISRKRRNANRGVERGLRGAKGRLVKRISLRRSTQTRQRPHLHCDFVPKHRWGIIGERRDRRLRRKNAQDAQEKFLEAMQRKVPALPCIVWSREKAHLTA